MCFYDLSYPLPPSMLEAYLGNHPAPKTLTGLRSALRSAMMGWCTLMLNTSRWTPEEHEVAKREFALYKTRLRPFIATGDVYHVLPRPDGKNWDGMQYADAKSGNGVLFVFRTGTDQDIQVVKLKGLNARKRYMVEAIDGSCSGKYTGAELMSRGLTVKLSERGSSDLIFLNEVR
jgi:alpha-galactosidase